MDSGQPTDCGTDTVSAHVVIESDADLAALDGVRAIEGELQINRTDFTNLNALGCIEEVGGELTIFGNDSLDDLTGLENLQRVGGGLVISENAALTDIDSFDELAAVQGSLIIRNNPVLTEVSGFASLVGVGTLIVRENETLTHIDGLAGLRTVGSLFAVTHNPELCITSVNRVGNGITTPAVPPDDWSTRANNENC